MNSWKPAKGETFALVVSIVVKGSGCQINGLSEVDLGLMAAVLSNSHKLAVINAGTSKQTESIVSPPKRLNITTQVTTEYLKAAQNDTFP